METNKSGLVTGLGITGLVIGIIALIVSFIPCFGIYAFGIGLVGLIISVVGLIIAIKKNAGKGLLIAAIVVSVLGSAIAFWQYQKIKSGLNEIKDQLEQTSTELEQ